MFKTLAFADQSNQLVKILVSTVSLNCGKCPKYTKMVYNSTHSQLKKRILQPIKSLRYHLKNFVNFFQGQCLLIEYIYIGYSKLKNIFLFKMFRHCMSLNLFYNLMSDWSLVSGSFCFS